MSDSSNVSVHDEDHTGPIKNPKQLLVAVFFSFIIPIFLIIGLVYFVVSGNKPSADIVSNTDRITEKAQNDERDQKVNARIQKVGSIEIRDANREMRTGEAVFKAQCSACHTSGAAGAPKFGDASAWAPRIKSGFDSLYHSALKGKNAMPAQGGGDADDFEIARAVVYMANAGGAKFAEPQKGAAVEPPK